VQRLLANAGHELGRLNLDLGQRDLAVAAARESLAQYETLLAVDPSNLTLLGETCAVRLDLAEIEALSGHAALASGMLERVGVDRARLAPKDKQHNRRLTLLDARRLALLGRLALAADTPLVTAALEAHVANVRAAESADSPLDREQAVALSAVELTLGDLLARDATIEAAAGRWSAVVARLRPIAGSDNFRVLTLLARAEARVGHTGEARALAQRIETSKYRHPDYAVLVEELARKSWSGQQPIHSSSR